MTRLVEIQLNGTATAIIEQESLAQLLARLDINGRRVAVEVNSELIPRELHPQHVLQAGDQVEVVTLVGGG